MHIFAHIILHFNQTIKKILSDRSRQAAQLKTAMCISQNATTFMLNRVTGVVLIKLARLFRPPSSHFVCANRRHDAR